MYRYSVLSLLLMFGVAIYSASPQQIDAKSVAAVWLFEDGKGKVAKDASGHDNHAEFVNDGIKWVKGKFGKGVQLNGDDQWLTIETEKGKKAVETDFKEKKNFSIHAWVFAEEDPTGKCIIWRGLGCSSWSQYLLGTGAHENGENTTDATFHIRQANGGAKLEVRGDTIDKKKWTHVVGTYDGKTLSIYQDGKLIKSEKVDAVPWASPEHVYIGADPGCGKRCQWKGIIDEVALFNVTLNAAQVKALSSGFEKAMAVQADYKLPTYWSQVKIARD